MTRQNSARERQTTHFPAFETDAPIDHAASLDPFQALVKRLSECYGPSGSEEQIRDLVRDEIKNFVDQVRVDALGNLIAQRRGSGSHRKKIMLAAHLDELGLMATFIDGRGFCRFGALGHVKPLTLLGARVRFGNGTMGVIGCEANHAASDEIDMDALFLDLGVTASSSPSVQIGDSACFVREFVETGDLLVGKALDDRAGCAVLVETLRQLRKSPHDLYFAFTVQQKVGARGAGAAAFAIQPDAAFVVDTATTNDTPGAASGGVALSQGPVIKIRDQGALTSPSARQMLQHAAREAHVSIQLDVKPRSNGDSMPIQASRQGVPTAALALPIRHHNTTSEMIHRADAENTVKLLLALLSKPI